MNARAWVFAPSLSAAFAAPQDRGPRVELLRARTAAALAALTDTTEFVWGWRLGKAFRDGYGVFVRENGALFGAALTVAPYRVDGPREAWERLVAVGLLPEDALSDPRRAFEVATEEWEAHLRDLPPPWPTAAPDYWRTPYPELDTSVVTRLAPQPGEIQPVVEAAAFWPFRLAAEELGLELGRRVAARAGDRPEPSCVVWAQPYVWRRRFVPPGWAVPRARAPGERRLLARFEQVECRFAGVGHDREVVLVGGSW